MSPIISHSISNSSAISTAKNLYTSKKLKTPLKASVVILTTLILASCGSDGSSTSYYTAPSDIPSNPETGNGTGGDTDNGTGGDTDNGTGDDTDNGAGGDTDNGTGDDTDNGTGDDTDNGAGGDTNNGAGGDTDNGAGGDTDNGAGGEATDAELQQALKDLDDARAEAQKAQQEVAAAKAEAEKLQQELEEAQNASGSGNSEQLKAIVEAKTAAAAEAALAVTAKEKTAADAIAAAQAQTTAAEEALQAANNAAAAAEIKNAAESAKSGVQTLNVDVVPLNKVFNTTTRDFDADSTSVVARADLASESAPGAADGLLGPLTIAISGDNDAEVSDTNGFKAHEDTAQVDALGNKLPLTYTSTYKDFGDEMRIGHIDGQAVFSDLALPVNGAAVIGNATQAANMPTEGSVGYSGDATHRQLGIGNAIEFGSSVFTADFVNKSLEGNLSFAKAGDINLKASIAGNTFSGTADTNDGYATEGGFYGGDAQYLGGVYEGNGAQGTYGAKSDTQSAAEQAAIDAQAAADIAKAQTAEQQAAADTAKAAAEKAVADAQKAQAALERAQANLESAGEGGDGGLADALARAEAAESAQTAAEDLAAKAQAAQQAAESAKAAADTALIAAQNAADKAVGDAKVAAQQQVAQAQAETEAANTAALQAKVDAEAAKQEAQTAKSEKDRLVAAAEDSAQQSEQAALQAQQAASAATKLAAAEKAKAQAAQADAQASQTQLTAAQAALEQAEQALAEAQANGGNTEALQAEVDRRDAALTAANGAAAQAQQTAADAIAAAQAQTTAAEEALQAANNAAAAAEIKNAAESAKSGVQTLNVDVVPLNKVFNTTTRDFDADSTSVVARADLASESAPGAADGLLGPLTIAISGDNDAEVSDTNGFKAHEDTAQVDALGNKLPLTYTSTYKDFGDEMRIGHIDGQAVFSDLALPVNGAAVIGNATQAANMPTEGSVGYSGDATHRQLGIGNAIEFGSSVFTADFVKKAVDGKLSFAKAGDINLKASIAGNTFSGTADTNDGYATEGGFYGGDAQYLGGVYEGNGAQGTYGAKSDTQSAAEQAAIDAQAAADIAKAQTAEQQAAADTAKAAAEKAVADAQKAQAALERAQANLESAGEGGDGGLADALARAEAAESAQTAAEDLASKAQIAQQAAQNAEQAAKAAQKSAEDALVAAQAAADKAIGDAKAAAQEQVAQAQAETEAANSAALQAKANAEAAELARAEAEDKVIEANSARDEAIQAKNEAEQRAQEAEDALKASQELPPAPVNPDAPASSTITGIQSNNMDANGIYKESLRGGVVDNTSASFDVLTTRVGELDTIYITDPLDLTLRNASDKSYKESDFKEHNKTLTVKGTLSTSNIAKNRDLSYTSVYNNFNEDMQIGHVYGVLDSTVDGKLSTVYAQGKSTSAQDMEYMKALSQYNIDNNIDDGKVDYEGVATYMENGNIDGPMIGSSKFNVDFVDQQVDGSLSFSGLEAKKVKAEITGNKFAGNWNGLDTQGSFYGDDANLLGGVYSDSTGKGTYGAEKINAPAPVDPTEPTEPVNPPVPADTKMTGFQSTALSSIEQNVAGTQLDNAIGYVTIRDDASDFTETVVKNGSVVPVDNRQGDNFTSFDTGVVRADMVKPENVEDSLSVSLQKGGEVIVEAGKGGFNPKFKYSAVYQNFDGQMQVGHVYGNFNSLLGDVSRAANVYVQGHLTDQADIDYLKQVNEGKASYTGNATYIENIHLGDTGAFEPAYGTSAFDVDFVNNSVKGELAFDGNFEYMPEGNNIGIEATIDGNTFAGNVNGIDTAGGFYGEDAKFLGGIYQDAAIEGGKGDLPGTGTRFQGTFGAEKQ